MLTAGMERGNPLSVEEQRRVMEQHGTQAHIKDMRQNLTTDNYVRQMPRRWRIGEVYSPRDMKPAEMSKWRQGRPPKKDMVDILGFSPLDNYKVRCVFPHHLPTLDKTATTKKSNTPHRTSPSSPSS